MADDPNERGQANRNRVDVHERRKVEYWSKEWGVTREQRETAVRTVSPMIEDVAIRVGKAS